MNIESKYYPLFSFFKDYEILYRPRKNLEEDFLILVSPIQKCKDYLDNRPESWNFS